MTTTIRVLYAEDDPQFAGIVGLHFLGAPEIDLAVVESGRGCLAMMEHDRFDLLLLDLGLPDLDGLQVLGELTARRDPTPVIMVSGQGQHELAVRALRAGAVDCIDKNSPDLRRIHEIVRHACVRQRRRAPLAPVPPPPQGHRVLLLDPEAAVRKDAETFFRNSAPRFRLTAGTGEMLASFFRGETICDAIVLGPRLAPVAMLDTLRQIRSHDDDLPVIVISLHDDAETTVAAFKLGAQDFLLHGPACLGELVFSLNHILRRAETERLNRRLATDLADLNRSLADEVATRTRELEAEIAVRRAAEQAAAAQATRAQALASRVLRVQEDERHAIARELHDQVGQLLTGLRFRLESAQAVSAPAAAPALAEALTVTDDLLCSVRALTLQLRPRVLDDLGLRPALEWLTDNFRRQTSIEVELSLDLPPGRLAPALETTVYRLIQEALTNVARHSGARAAAVTVTAGESRLHVEVADRGCGFDATAALARRDSLGLAGLIERVALAGGQLELFSQPGRGTRIHAEFALPSPASALLAS